MDHPGYHDTDKSCKKGNRLNGWEHFYVQIYRPSGLLMEEQNIPDLNPLFTIAQVRHKYWTDTQTDRHTVTHTNTQISARSRNAPHTNKTHHTRVQGEYQYAH